MHKKAPSIFVGGAFSLLHIKYTLKTLKISKSPFY
ncbi:hypothetical protein protein [Bacillus cereus G9241]|nr:hypothetical protein protein [Bacillus cereus G9241]